MWVTSENFPHVHQALNLINSDDGASLDEVIDVPTRWSFLLPTIEETLGTLAYITDKGTDAWLNCDLFVFCCGDEQDMQAIVARDPKYLDAHTFLNDFFNG